MAADYCLTCGRYGPIEAHHVAGRHNVPELVVPVCVEDHEILTNWQLAAGIELDADTPRHPTDVRRALTVGFLHLMRLMVLRGQCPVPPATGSVAQMAARAISRVLDLAAPFDRAGRWLPDSYIEPRTAAPVPINAAGQDAQLIEFTHLIGTLLRLLGDMPPLTAEVWGKAMADPRSMPERLAAVEASDTAAPSIALLIATHIQAAERVLHLVLTLDEDGWRRLDERDLNEVRVYFDTGYRLLDKIVRAALLPPDGPVT